MGWRSLSLQMVPWCFHVVAGSPDSDPDRCTARPEPVRLVGSDGRVTVYHRPVSAAELMKEHPCHLVCRSDSFYIGQKVPALAAADRLQPGHSYFLLPSQFFHSVLSFVSLASSLLLATSAGSTNGNRKQMPVLRPFDIQKTAAGALQIRVCDEFLIERVKEEEMEGRGRVCSTAELEKEYKELCGKVKKWRPRLEVVMEGTPQRRKGWAKGFLNFGRFGRRRKRDRIIDHYN